MIKLLGHFHQAADKLGSKMQIMINRLNLFENVNKHYKNIFQQKGFWNRNYNHIFHH